MDGDRTPPRIENPSPPIYVGGHERNARIDSILGIDRLSASSTLGIFSTVKNIEPDSITLEQYRQLKLVMLEEDLMLAQSGEPRSVVMDRLRNYRLIIDAFSEFEPIFLEFVQELHQISPVLAREFEEQASKCNLSELRNFLENDQPTLNATHS